MAIKEALEVLVSIVVYFVELAKDLEDRIFCQINENLLPITFDQKASTDVSDKVHHGASAEGFVIVV